MATTFGFLGLMLGLDSLAVGFGLGGAVSRKQRYRLVAAFAAFDGLASLLGWAFGTADWRYSLEWSQWLGPAGVAVYGVYVLGLAWNGSRIAESDRGGWLALGLPLCLSLDNFVMGTGAETTLALALLTALSFACISGALAMAGLGLGAAVAQRARLRAEWLGGAVLVVVAIALVCKETLS
jgi:putative Mn2+ efflux pump MntP